MKRASVVADQTTSISRTIELAIDSDSSTEWQLASESRRLDAFFEFANFPEISNGDHVFTLQLELPSHGGASRFGLRRFRLSVASDAPAVQDSKLRNHLTLNDLNRLDLSIGKANVALGGIDEAANVFARLWEQSDDPNLRDEIIHEAAALEDMMEALADLRSNDATFHAAVALYYDQQGDVERSRAAAARARSLLEPQLDANPASAQLALQLASVVRLSKPVNWTILEPSDVNSADGAELTVLEDHSILSGGKHPDHDRITVTAETDLKSVRVLRLEALTHDSLPNGGPGRGPDGMFVMERFDVLGTPTGTDESLKPTQFARMVTDYFYQEQPPNPETGKWHLAGGGGQSRVAFFDLNGPLAGGGEQLEFRMDFFHSVDWPKLSIGRFRLAVSDDPLAFDIERHLLREDAPGLCLGAFYHAIGDFDREVRSFGHALDSASETTRADLATEIAVYEDSLDQLIQRAPQDPALRIGQARYVGQKRIDEKRFEEAVRVLTEALSTSPADVDSLRLRAVAHTNLRQWSAAMTDYAQVSEVAATELQRQAAERARAICQIRLGEFQQAGDRFMNRMLVATQSENLRTMAFEACAAQLLAERPEAARVAAEWLLAAYTSNDGPSADKTDQLIRVFMAHPGWVNQDNRDSLLEFAKATQSDPQIAAAAIHYRLGDLERAKPLLDAPTEDYGFRALASMLLCDLGMTDRSREVFASVDDWVRQQRAQDPDSEVPYQVDWTIWSIRKTLAQEAAKKLAALDDLQTRQ